MNSSKDGIVQRRPQITIPTRLNIDRFHASGIPIFVLPEIYDLLQEYIAKEERLSQAAQ